MVGLSLDTQINHPSHSFSKGSEYGFMHDGNEYNITVNKIHYFIGNTTFNKELISITSFLHSR